MAVACYIKAVYIAGQTFDVFISSLLGGDLANNIIKSLKESLLDRALMKMLNMLSNVTLTQAKRKESF